MDSKTSSVSPSPTLPVSPSSSHSIRLRGPWSCQPISSTEGTPLPSGGTLPIPGDWCELLGADFRGTARFSRHFNRPTGLESGQHVWLVIDDYEGDLSAHLNNIKLLPVSPSSSALRYDITTLLQPRNELTIELRSLAAPGRLGLVRLEIE